MGEKTARRNEIQRQHVLQFSPNGGVCTSSNRFPGDSTWRSRLVRKRRKITSDSGAPIWELKKLEGDEKMAPIKHRKVRLVQENKKKKEPVGGLNSWLWGDFTGNAKGFGTDHQGRSIRLENQEPRDLFQALGKKSAQKNRSQKQ